MLKKIILCIALAGAPQFAAAQSVQDQIVTQLRAQGFSEIAINRTWLGRIRVVALRDDLRRELVFNPQTGEILRDFWRTLDGDDEGPRLFNPGTSSIGNTGRDDDDGYDDYDDDEDSEEDDDDTEDDDDDDEYDDD